MAMIPRQIQFSWPLVILLHNVLLLSPAAVAPPSGPIKFPALPPTLPAIQFWLARELSKWKMLRRSMWAIILLSFTPVPMPGWRLLIMVERFGIFQALRSVSICPGVRGVCPLFLIVISPPFRVTPSRLMRRFLII